MLAISQPTKIHGPAKRLYSELEHNRVHEARAFHANSSPEKCSKDESQQQKSRKLDLMKCERCRLDKQKCLPAERKWPTKCDRCIAKGLPCSESSRVVRKSRIASTAPTAQPSSKLIKVCLQESQIYEKYLREWSALMNYHRHLRVAVQAFSSLKAATFQPFLCWVTGTVGCKAYDRLVNFVTRAIQPAITLSANELLCLDTSHQSIAQTSLTMLIGQGVISGGIFAGCSLCDDGYDKQALEQLVAKGDAGGEYIVRQNQLITHFCKKHHWADHTLGPSLVDKEVARLFEVGDDVLKQVGELFRRHDIHTSEEDLSSFGIFHNELVGHWLFIRGREKIDCLGRSTLHQWLDAMDTPPTEVDLEILRRNHIFFDINKQDFLGRTALHIACLRHAGGHGWLSLIKCLQDLGVRSDVVTVFGHLPLHYAVMGWTGREIELCKSLMDGCDFTRVDCKGYTALYYASWSADPGLFEFLWEAFEQYSPKE